MSWATKPLAEVADFCLGKMLDQKKNKGEPLPYLANVNVRWGSFDLDDVRLMRFKQDEFDRYGLSYGDIVMCEGGEPGRCAIWKEPVAGMMFQKALHRIRPRDGLDYRFLYYSFLYEGRRGSLAALFTGATIKHLPRQNLAKVQIPVPPLHEQERIADILSAYDDLIENNRRRIELLEEAARQLYKEWFVRFRFPGHEHVKIIDGVPEGWEKCTLGSVLTLQRGFDLPVKQRKVGSIPIYASTGINGYHNQPKVKGPGVITGRSGSLGTVLFVPQDYWPLNTTLWVKEFKRIDPYFAVYLLRSLNLESYNAGAAVPTLNRNNVHPIEMVLPFQTLLDSFTDFVRPIFTQIENLERNSKKLSEARDLLLPKLMSGEIAA